jgi:STE24 endopeptidase
LEGLIFGAFADREDDMNVIAVIILIALGVNLLLHISADICNLKNLSTELPDAFKDWYDPERYRDSQEYLRVNTRFEWLASSVSLAAFLAVWFGHGFPLLDQWVRSLAQNPIIRGLVYIGLLVGAKALISLPFSIYATFGIEERFGFNRTDAKTFVLDLIKQTVLGVLIGGPVLAAILSFFQYAGANAWWYCWIAVVVFMIVMQFAVPTWIMPLFNKFTPLEPGELKTAIMNYAESIGFPLKNVFVMDGSKRSSKANAFFAGFGRHKRIVLFDTLIKNHSVSELVGILAHEMGHYKKKHIYWMMLAGIVQSGIILYLLSLFISAPPLFEAFYMQQPSVYAGLVFFGVLYSPIDFFIGIFMQMFSRKNEYAADRFAAETTNRPNAFIRALKRLAVHNLSNLRPHPLYVFLNYSHPPILDRIEAISKVN